MLDDSELAWKSASTSQDETVLSRNFMRSPVTWAALGFVFSPIIYLLAGVVLLRSIQRPLSLPAPTETATTTIISNSQEFWPESLLPLSLLGTCKGYWYLVPFTTRVFVDDDAWKDTDAAGDYLWLHEVVTRITQYSSRFPFNVLTFP
jgi:hypothetical protein